MGALKQVLIEREERGDAQAVLQIVKKIGVKS
jgi:hypothetical protein